MHSRCSMPVTTIASQIYYLVLCQKLSQSDVVCVCDSSCATLRVVSFRAFCIINATTWAGLHISIPSNRFVRVQHCVAAFVCTTNSVPCLATEQFIGTAASTPCHNTATSTDDADILCAKMCWARGMCDAHKNELHQYIEREKKYKSNTLQDNRIFPDYTSD